MCIGEAAPLFLYLQKRGAFLMSIELKNTIKSYENYIEKHGIDEDVIKAYSQAVQVAFLENDVDYALCLSKRAKEIIELFVLQLTGGTIFDLDEYCNKNNASYEMLEVWYEILLSEAPYLFDSYLLYLEKNREESEKFYAPKREQLNRHGLIQAMQDLEDDKLDILSISMPPGTQKTTLEKFFCSWIIGKHPKDYSLFFSHSDDITRMFYDGVLDITTNFEEYTWNEIFPKVKLKNTDAKRQRINFDKEKSYANIQCTSVGSKNAGKVRCNRYLYCDDLIGGIEEALNKRTLDKLWRIYGTDARQRKLNEKVKEIHIATRWSVHDVIGRLKQIYAGDERARFIAVPDIDPVTGKSNFDYKYNGMSVEFFHDQESCMDEISYKCLYKNEPIEREGLLYHEDDIRRFISMPIREPDAIIGVCDVKNKGTDFMFLPCMYQYDDDFYLLDCICDDNTDYGVQYERLSNIIVEHNMQQCEFESNSGGDRVSYEVNKRVEKKGGRCNITDKPTETNKETRIIVNADWVKKHILFKDRENYKPKDDYGIMMSWLMTYSVVGKNEHDDVPDGLANFALFVTKPQRRKEAFIMSSPI
jgi:predicted phage terminase large subunit-like protein